MTNPVIDINDIRKRIRGGEKIAPEIIRSQIERLRDERFEKVVAKAEKRIKKGDLSPAEQDKSLEIFDGL